MLLEYIIWAFVLYWVFRFVFNFLVPVFRVTREMKEQVRSFQNTTPNRGYQQTSDQYNANTSKPQQKSQTGDYIDFEEVK